LGKRKRKKQSRRPDDYFNNGEFEMVRFGERISMKNIRTPEQNEKHEEYLAQSYPAKKAEIDSRVHKIKEKIGICDPLNLLRYTRDMALLPQMNKFSEYAYNSEEISTMRALEYIQSVLVSSENGCSSTAAQEDQSELFGSILLEIEELYKEFVYFYLYWSAYVKNDASHTDEMIKYIVEAQTLYWVRGNRYQVFELEHLRNLLPPHNDILVELFEINVEQILEGLKKLQYALSQEKGDALMGLGKEFDEFSKAVESGEDPEVVMKRNIPVVQPIMNKAFGYTLNDVAAVTGWSNGLVDALSFGLNEYDSFYGETDFSGWPILELPVQRKPFIKLEDTVYCFDYYSLFDNFYRVIQKAVFQRKPEYINTWATLQQSASETMVENLFKKLLPGAATYTDNYYPKKESLKQLAENDLLVIYEDVLLIVEVKAGSFPATPPILDYAAHMRAYKSLVEKADYQCERTYQYIVKDEAVALYNHDKTEKVIINPTAFRDIYTFSVTVENFNEFAARAEKLSFLHMESKSIVISFDDLIAYSEYFTSPLYFLHFLKQRKLATETENIAVRDELDHLGMYIKHNVYSITANEFPKQNQIMWHGYREELDNYFCRLYLPELHTEKPCQNIPHRIEEIVELIDTKKTANRVFLSTFLLDICDNGKNDLAYNIERVSDRQKEVGHMMPLIAFGEVRYCAFIHTPQIKIMSYQQKLDYVYSAVLSKKEANLVWIDLHYDESEILYDVNYQICSYGDIPAGDYQRLQELSDVNEQSRIASYILHSKKHKVGRNDPCPCGSEKKFKKCCCK
jgi:uncharacterized protein YchJ